MAVYAVQVRGKYIKLSFSAGFLWEGPLFYFPETKIHCSSVSFCVDPAGFTPASPLTKGGILLHKLQAQGPRVHDKTKEVLFQGLLLLVSRDP